MSLERVTDNVEAFVTTECKVNFNDWSSDITRMCAKYEEAAPGITKRMQGFIEINEPSFYKSFDSKCKVIINELLSNIVAINNKNLEKVSLKDQTDRLKLETYLIHKKNARASATALGIPKSTMHDWIHKNKELIISEENKTNLVTQ